MGMTERHGDMVLNIQFQLSGIMIVLIVCGLYLRRRAGWKISEKIFCILLIEELVTIILDVVSVMTINYRDSLPPYVNDIVCKLYLTGIVGVAFLTLIYLFADIYKDAAFFTVRLVVYSVIYVLSAVTIFVLPIEYYVNEKSRSIYSLGGAVRATYIINLLYILISIFYMLYRRKTLSRQRRNAVCMILGVFAGTAVIQYFFNQLLIIGFAMSICMLFIYLFMENTADFVDPQTGLYNKSSMTAYLNKYFERGTQFVVYLFSINNFDFMLRMFGAENTNKLINEQAYFCQSLNHIHSFRFAHHQIALVAKKEYYDAAVIKDIIDRHFKIPYIIADTPILLNVSACLIEDSSILKSGGETVYMLEQFIKTAKEKNVEKLLVIDDEALDKHRKQYEVENILGWALENDKFQVYYQPIYSVEKKKYVSAEALLRLWDRDNNFVSPDIFIPVAEKNGYILEIGNLVFEKVCQFISGNNLRDELGIEFVEINLSVVQCMQSTLADELHKKMKQYNIPPEFIIFEITETSVLDSQGIMTQNMKELIRCGSSFALDDYGSGYSNLNYMIEFPFNIVKFDKELVWSYFKSEKGKIGLEFAIKMVKHLKMKIIAEGVETKEQLDKLVELGVDYIQGFYFSRPVEEGRFIESCQV